MTVQSCFFSTPSGPLDILRKVLLVSDAAAKAEHPRSRSMSARLFLSSLRSLAISASPSLSLSLALCRSVCLSVRLPRPLSLTFSPLCPAAFVCLGCKMSGYTSGFPYFTRSIAKTHVIFDSSAVSTRTNTRSLEGYQLGCRSSTLPRKATWTLCKFSPLFRDPEEV